MKTVRWKNPVQRPWKMNAEDNKKTMLRKWIRTFEISRQTITNQTTGFKNRLKRRATKDDFIYSGSFHEAAGPVFLIAQLFGVMPVNGVKSPTAKGLSFSWFSVLTIYSLCIWICLLAYLILTLKYAFRKPIEMKEIDPIIFYGSISFVYGKFIILARKWPELMRNWDAIEEILPANSNYTEKAALANKIKMIALVILVMSLIEHLLNIITVIHNANYCNPGHDPVQEVMLAQLAQMFHVFSYSTSKAICGKILNIIATFAWDYMDLFVMVVGVGLSQKFRQVNTSLFRIKVQISLFTNPTSEAFWAEHRHYYRNLCNLCDEIDNAISQITMVSFSNNIYFICIQLLRSLNEMPSFAHAVYFWFALVFLIGRTLAVSLYSAQINDESKRPVEVFRCVPKESWCLEVKRFSEEVSIDVIALSGMKFFHLTRNLVLSVAGTIVTYELVLIQFQVQDKIGC